MTNGLMEKIKKITTKTPRHQDHQEKRKGKEYWLNPFSTALNFSSLSLLIAVHRWLMFFIFSKIAKPVSMVEFIKNTPLNQIKKDNSASD